MTKENPFPPLSEQDQIVEEISGRLKLAETAILNQVFSPRWIWLLERTHPDYVSPTGDNVAYVVSLLVSRGYSREHLARRLGLPVAGSHLTRWESSGAMPSKIGYPAWRLLCNWAGLTIDTMLEDNNGSESNV